MKDITGRQLDPTGTVHGRGDGTTTQPVYGYVFDIKRYAIHDGPGIRTTVFFKGCPLRCRWCHNPESWKATPELSVRPSRCVRCGRCVELCPNRAVSLQSHGLVSAKPRHRRAVAGPATDPDKCVYCGRCVDTCPAGAREIIGKHVTVAEVMMQVKKDVLFYDQSGGGVTCSGGEALTQPQFLLGLLSACRAEGIHTAVDTTCYVGPEIVEAVAGAADLFLCDIKHMNSEVHKQYTGVGIERILENIRTLSRTAKEVFIRIPVVPGFNDGQDNIRQTAEFVRSLKTVRRVDILPYNRGGLEKAVRLTGEIKLMQAQVPGDDTMTEIAEVLRSYGFEVKTGG